MNIDKTLLCRALGRWGTTAQLEMLMEECMELALATRKMLRYGNNEVTRQDLYSEIADVYIMIEQIKLLFLDDGIQRAVDCKMGRLREVINAHSNNA